MEMSTRPWTWPVPNPPPGHQVFYGSEGGDFVSLLEANKVEHVSLPQNHKQPIRVVATLGRLVRLIKRNK